MNQEVLLFHLSGKNLLPQTTPLGELATILISLEKSIEAVIPTLPNTFPDEGIPLLSLGSIEEGSNRLFIYFSFLGITAFSSISEAIYLKNINTLPQKAIEQLCNISKTLIKNDWALTYTENEKFNIKAGTISKEYPIKILIPQYVNGSTTFYGRCIRVGGVKPHAEVRLLSGDLKIIDLNEEMAKELAKNLYDEVGIEVKVKWDTNTWNMENLEAIRILSYRSTDPLTAFEQLSKAAGNHFDGINVTEYVNSIRYEENEL